jgi:hypothetical protein
MRFSLASVFALVALSSVGCAQRGAESPENVSLSASSARPAWASQMAVGEPEMSFEEARPAANKRGGSAVQQGLRPSKSAQPVATR